MKVPTPEQLNAPYRATKAEDPVLAVADGVAALTGMRRGELVALRWSNIDLTAAVLHVQRATAVVNGVTHTGPIKTHAVRRVALDEMAVGLLRERWQEIRNLS